MTAAEKRSLLKDILCCPRCRKDLDFSTDHCTCRECRCVYPFVDGKFFFREYRSSKDERIDVLDRWKTSFKKYSAFYTLMVRIISPVCFPLRLTKEFQAAGDVILEIGSGNTPVLKQTINCDYYPYDGVDVVLDAARLPFKAGAVDAVLNIAVLEHLPEPERVVGEMHRILKPQGKIFSVVPFMQPYHASPYDFKRWTISGTRDLHKAFREIACGVYSGPVSGFLWVLQEFLATLLSFGSVFLRTVLFLLFMILTFPLKYLDLLISRWKTAAALASSFYFYGYKEGPA